MAPDTVVRLAGTLASWALRELVVHDRAAVETFLTEHDDLLVPHVRREVRNKLTTGRTDASVDTRSGTRGAKG